MYSLRLDRAASVHLAHPIAQVLNRQDRPRIPILMYHGVRSRLDGRHPYYETTTEPKVFARQMQFLCEQGCTAITLDDAVNRLFEQRTESRKDVVITFDDGYEDFYTNAYPILAERGFMATVFVVTGFVQTRCRNGSGAAFLNWNQVRELHACGIQIGSHTVTHPELRSLRFEEMNAELGRSKAMIEENLGAPVKSFSYPFAFPEADRKFTRSLAGALAEHGYLCGVSTIIGTATRHANSYFLPRIPVNSYDDLRFFQAKLEGAYDWLHATQYLVKIIKGSIRLGASSRIPFSILNR